jgi:hypothetical protein
MPQSFKIFFRDKSVEVESKDEQKVPGKNTIQQVNSTCRGHCLKHRLLITSTKIILDMALTD